MNIKNLNQQELEQLQMLLNKMNPKAVALDPIDKMVEDILEEFDFQKVQLVMDYLNWQWSDKQVPTISDLKETAERLLRNAADLRLGEYESEHWEVAIMSGTGGLQATAYCDETKTKITMLDLKFVIAEWDAEIEN